MRIQYGDLTLYVSFDGDSSDAMEVEHEGKDITAIISDYHLSAIRDKAIEDYENSKYEWITD